VSVDWLDLKREDVLMDWQMTRLCRLWRQVVELITVSLLYLSPNGLGLAISVNTGYNCPACISDQLIIRLLPGSSKKCRRLK
jgi:hypothetical protein